MPDEFHSADTASMEKPRRHTLGIIVLLIVLAVAGWGIFSRIQASASLNKRTDEQSTVTVVTLKAPHGPADEELVLPGTVQAWHEAPIYARTSGYLKEWNVDIGAHVKAGDVLAEIETPEIDAQLRQTEADLATAEANSRLAQSTAQRWKVLLKTNSVSKQEAEEKLGDASAKAAAVASARANLDRLHDLESFKRVLAPFDGTITARNTDTGALISAASTASGQELFRIADTGKLRIYVQVPENYAGAITPGMQAQLGFAEHPGQSFPAALVHTASALDPVTRTLLAQFEADNGDGALLPGGYTQVHLKLSTRADTVRLPVNTLLFRSDGMQAATIDGNGRALLKPITIGRDFGKEVEVVSGIEPDEAVIVNPPDSLVTGQPVNVAPPAAEKPAPDDKKP